MTSSSSPSLERGRTPCSWSTVSSRGIRLRLPASSLFVRNRAGFTSPLVLFETKNILTKVYSVDAAAATRKLLQFGTGPVVLLDLDALGATSAFQLADTHGLDLTDAHLLHLARRYHASFLATEDQHLAQMRSQAGVTPQSPLDAALRQQIAAWESANLAFKGVPRISRRVHQWLGQAHLQAARDFWSQTGGGSHLP
jgi:predicted nucleic acid-binding protein